MSNGLLGLIRGGSGRSEPRSETEFVRQYNLAEVDWSDHWERIYIDDRAKEKLVNYGLLEQRLQADAFDRMTLSRHGAVLLSGPPGTGKTTLARGAGYEIANRLDRERLGVTAIVFKQIEVRHLFSSDHGDSPKLVQEAFDAVITDAEDGECYQVVLLDEVESLFANRENLGETDPMDAIRAVNTALDALDTLATVDNVYVISTSNQPGAVDSAFVDRTDEQFYIGNPAPEFRRRILEDVFDHLDAAFDAELSPTDRDLERLVDLSDGFSGRRMRKSVLSALARTPETVRDPGMLSIEQIVDEFEHKRAMFANANADYLHLGGRPDQLESEEQATRPNASPTDE